MSPRSRHGDRDSRRCTPRERGEDAGIDSLVVFGLVTLVVAGIRYSKVSHAIGRGDFRPNQSVIWTVTLLLLALGGLSLWWLFQR